MYLRTYIYFFNNFSHLSLHLNNNSVTHIRRSTQTDVHVYNQSTLNSVKYMLSTLKLVYIYYTNVYIYNCRA